MRYINFIILNILLTHIHCADKDNGVDGIAWSGFTPGMKATFLLGFGQGVERAIAVAEIKGDEKKVVITMCSPPNSTIGEMSQMIDNFYKEKPEFAHIPCTWAMQILSERLLDFNKTKIEEQIELLVKTYSLSNDP